MTQTSKTKLPTIRYSPQPISHYCGAANGVRVGPANSPFLAEDAEAWNLAFLSHPYEVCREHRDPQFTVLIRRTVNTVVDDSAETNLLGTLPAGRTLRSWLRLPAKQFVARLDATGITERLPMFKRYGAAWVATISDRARLCLPAPVADESLPEDRVLHTRDAEKVIERIRRM